MASLIAENGIVFDFSDQAPSPCKDFCQILITRTEVILRVWKIKRLSEIKLVPPAPIELKSTYEEFEHDEQMLSEIHRVFGKEMLEYVKAVASGHLDYLPRLENKVLYSLVRYLDLEDIAHLAQVSKRFSEICNSNRLWEAIYRDNSETPITDEMCELAENEGWKKLFFTNKLQLQVQLRRQSRKRRMSIDVTQ